MASKTLETRIPAHLRTEDGPFSTRARVIVYNKSAVKPEDIQDYADLANPEAEKQSLLSLSSHPYNLSLMASVIAHQGEAKAEELARGMVANFAQPPKAAILTRSKRSRQVSVALHWPILVTFGDCCGRPNQKR